MLRALSTATGDTLPNVADLILHRMTRRTNDTEYEVTAGGSFGGTIAAAGGGGGGGGLREQFGVQSPPAAAARGGGATPGGSPRRHIDRRPSLFSLGEGAGARRLAEVHVRAGIQLLLVQACSEVYTQHSRAMPAPAAVLLLDTLKGIASHAAAVDADAGLRHSLLLAQAADKVGWQLGRRAVKGVGARRGGWAVVCSFVFRQVLAKLMPLPSWRALRAAHPPTSTTPARRRCPPSAPWATPRCCAWRLRPARRTCRCCCTSRRQRPTL